MPYTLLELRTRARDRIGDPYKVGETARTTGRFTDININRSINDAIPRVAKDAVTTKGEPLLKKTAMIAAIAGESRYQLPADFVQTYGNKIFFKSSGTKYELYREDLSDLITGYDEDTTVTVPVGYQLHPSSRFLITEGIATGGTATTLEDSDRVDASANAFDDGAAVKDGEATALAANDIVENVTDHSEGAISAVTDHNTLTFSTSTEDVGISGGARNDFRLGDHYRVWSKEYTGEELWVALPPASNDQTTTVSHTTNTDTTERVVGTNATDQDVKQGQTFKVKKPTVVRSVALYFGDTSEGSTPTTTARPPIGNVVVRIETDSAGPSGTLVDFRAKASRSSIEESAWNEFTFRKPFRLAPNTTYSLTVEVETQSTFYADPTSVYYTVVQDDDAGYTDGQRYEYISSWTADATADLLFKINAVTAVESIEVPYVSKGQALSADTDTMDLPDHALEAVLLWVEYDLLPKGTMDRGRRDRVEALQLYRVAIDDLIRDLHRAHVPTRRQVSDEMTPYGVGARVIDPRIPNPLTWKE